MKRLTIFVSVISLIALVAASSAFMQSTSLPQLGGQKQSQWKNERPEALPRRHFNNNRLHKYIIKDNNTADSAVYSQLAKAKAIRNEIDYGSYKLIVVDEEAAGGRAALEAMPIAPRDEQNMINFNSYIIDTSSPQPLSKELPADLKQPRMSRALAGADAPGKGIYIVQFVGPIQDGWLKALEKTGARIISYAPHNAYVVSADGRAAGEMIKMKNSNAFVQWMGDYEPAYKLTPELHAARERGNTSSVRVTVQLIDSLEGSLMANQLQLSSLRYLGERRVLKYRNVTALIPASLLTELAKSDGVFAIEEDHEPVRLDEAQGQIVAGNLSDNAPQGPGYLSWLESKGFNSSQFGSFAVNVVDDAHSLTGHPDLPDSRIAFENNPTNQSGPQRGHGFLNAHIIGGFNNATGSAFEDSSGFNFGLGINPWARVGATAIFGSASLNPTSWEEVAYGQSSRISSNSWGFRFVRHYDSYAQEYDSIVRDAQSGVSGNQQLTVVFAAGNDGRQGIFTVYSPSTAKNVITVGASENVRRGGADGCRIDDSGADSAEDLAEFSGRGPVLDGRIKPDIVAPGTHIQAGVPQSNYNNTNPSICNSYFPPGQTLYGWSSGTSHSTPAVAGGAALVYQDFLNKGMAAPSPALVKAMLMNSASYMTGEGANDVLPSISQGMGRMDLGRAFDTTPRLLMDQTQIFSSSGETYQVVGSVATTDRPLRITLAWTDAPGAIPAAPWVNDLDLEVSINGQTYTGNFFSDAYSIADGPADGRNNVESVFLPAGVSGKFIVTVKAANIAGDGIPGDGDGTDQDFALVMYNANSAPVDSPIINVTPSRLSITSAIGGGNPPNQTLSVTNIGIGTLDWVASVDAPWLTLSPASGTAPSTLTASVDATGLPEGTYDATITFSSSNALNSPFRVRVTLAVKPVFEVTPQYMTFNSVGGAVPANQTITISNNDSIPRAWSASDEASWLTLSPASGTAPSTVTASVNPNGLSEGTYNGIITITPTHAPDSPVRIFVVLQVLSAFRTLPESLSFTATVAGVASPATQTVFIDGIGHSRIDYIASDDASWLTITPTTGTTVSRLTASINPSGLALGTYNAKIMIRQKASPNLLAKEVPVTLTVTQFTNGGFDQSADPWVFSGAAIRSVGSHPHSGPGYLILGGANSSTGFAYQKIKLAPGSSPNLSFWLSVESNETSPTDKNDLLFIEVRDVRGRLIKTLASFSNLDKGGPDSYVLRGNYSLAQFAGQTVRLKFRTKTNLSSITKFRVDDVSIQ